DGDQRIVRGRVRGGGCISGAAPGSLVLVRAAGAVGSGTSAHGHIPSGEAGGAREPVPHGAPPGAGGGQGMAAHGAARSVPPARPGHHSAGKPSNGGTAPSPVDVRYD